MEEQFFFAYHLKMMPPECMAMMPKDRRWWIQRFVKQKGQENEAMEAARRKAKNKR